VLIPWVLHPNRDNIWYEKIKENYGGNIDMFNSEINLIDIPNKTNKNRVVTIRVNDDILNKITDKLLERDLSISEYIRQLIEDDN
jgi:predicted DNA binding CopG/RHH family protein